MRRILSGSDGGEPIKVAATSSPGTAIHTVATGRTQRLTLQAVNTDGTDRLLTVQWGDTGQPDNSIEVTVPAGGGIVTVVDGLPLAFGKSVRAFAATANVVLITGYFEVQ